MTKPNNMSAVARLIAQVKLVVVVVIHSILFCFQAFLYLTMRVQIRANQQTPLKPKKISKITVIMPAKNEAGRIAAILETLENRAAEPESVEIIIADGGSTDDTPNMAIEASEDMKIYVRVFQDRGVSGRGVMINRAIRRANDESDAYLILHADTELPQNWDSIIRNALSDPHVVYGTFKFSVDRCFDSLPGAHATEIAVWIRCYCFWLPFGDQGMFVRREMYDIVGGIPNTVFLEDIQFATKCRKYALAHNMICYNADEFAVCSSRRWVKNGVAKTTLINFSIIFAFGFLGFTTEQLYEFYYGARVADGA